MTHELISSEQQKLARETDAILRFPGWEKATRKDFDDRKTALFLHGFTADAAYMNELMRQFDGAGFRALAFNYACFDGIDIAAKSLGDLLARFDVNGTISNNRLVLVGHSMGGLVARALVALEAGDRYVRKVITLGTPHGGTLTNGKLLRKFLEWGEFVSGLNPRGFSPKSRSARQLIGEDSAPTLIAQLRDSTAPTNTVNFFSLSGGYSYVEFGSNKIKNILANKYIQGLLEKPNDGLVDEASSDLSRTSFSKCAPDCTHVNNYSSYSRTNHTNLIRNQSVALHVVDLAN